MTEQEAMEELKCYRAKSGTSYPEEIEVAIKALEEVQKYREIGTVEELMDAVNKQMADKPQKVLTLHGTEYECKQCGNELSVNAFNGEYCHWCGQKLDWT